MGYLSWFGNSMHLLFHLVLDVFMPFYCLIKRSGIVAGSLHKNSTLFLPHGKCE